METAALFKIKRNSVFQHDASVGSEDRVLGMASQKVAAVFLSSVIQIEVLFPTVGISSVLVCVTDE